MTNSVARVKSVTTPWGDDKVKRYLSVSTGATYYVGGMIAIDGSGHAVKCDDTAGLQFDGLMAGPGTNVEVQTSDTFGDKWVQVERPFRFGMTIAAVAITDVGAPLYALYDNEVALAGTSHAIQVGWVDEVISATFVIVKPLYADVTGVAQAGNTLTFSGTTGANTLVMPDNLADALSVKEGSNSYLTFKTTDSSETVLVKKLLDVVAGINFSGVTTANVMTLPDNLADALNIKEGSNSYLKFTTTDSGEKVVVGKAITFASGALSLSGTLGLGYGTGAGGAVSQASSRTTGVTLNKVTGAITLVSAAGSATPASFTLTNSTIAATDTVLVSQKSGTDLYEVFVTTVGAGSCVITFFTTGGTTTETPVFNIAVVKAVAS